MSQDLPSLDGEPRPAAPVRGGGGELDRLLDVPVTVSAVLGKAKMPIDQLLKVGPGAMIELDRRVGEMIDIRVNDRLVARGEVVLVDEQLGVTMTEIVTSAG